MKSFALAFLLAISAIAAQAQTIGIKFAEIPVGTEFHYKNIGGGAMWVERYVGERSGLHVMESHFLRLGTPDPQPFLIVYYSNEGLRVRMEKRRIGSVVTFEPYDCARSAAPKCTHLRTYEVKGESPFTKTNHYEGRQTGRVLLVIRNATGNRLKRRFTFDERGIITSVKNISNALSKGHKLIKEQRPAE